jgi:hypothetical protein
MAHELRLSDEELAELGRILQRELDTTRGELRRTRNLDYKEEVRHRMEMTDRLRRIIETAKAGQHVGVS